MATQMFKIKKIKEAIKDNNITELKILAKKHGFINNKLRKQVWPLLLGIKPRNRARSVGTKSNSKKLLRNRSLSNPRLQNNASTDSNASNKSNYDQIEKDIARSALNFYKISEDKIQESRNNLGRILHSMFDESTEMHYIQGFNDVVSVFYAVCDNIELSQRLSKRVAKTLLSDYIMNGSSELNFTSLQLIFKIIAQHDLQLSQLFETMESNHLLSFCISWLLTWFAHEIKEINSIARIYDYCLSHNNKQISLYLSTALLIYFKKQLLRQVSDDITLHCFFQQLKWEKIDFNKVIALSEELFEAYPPNIISPYNSSNIITPLDCEEIKDDFCSESESEFNGTYTPSFDPSESMTDFEIESVTEESKDSSNSNSKFKLVLPKVSINVRFLDSIGSIPDTITSLIDETVSLFGNEKSQSKKCLNYSDITEMEKMDK